MPFTLSHAAAALPLRPLLRGAAVFPALVIGTFVPDVPYFLPDPLYDINAHQLPGFLLFGIPCGWALYLSWLGVFLRPCQSLLPRRLARLLDAPERAYRWWPVTASLMAGAATHVAWDAFTHRRGMAVHAWPALAHPVGLAGHALPAYEILQHGSTIVGLVWLALHARRRSRERAEAATEPGWPSAGRLAIAAALALGAATLVWCEFALAAAPPRLSAYTLVCRSVSSAAVVATLYALSWHALYLRRGSRAGTRRR